MIIIIIIINNYKSNKSHSLYRSLFLVRLY